MELVTFRLVIGKRVLIDGEEYDTLQFEVDRATLERALREGAVLLEVAGFKGRG